MKRQQCKVLVLGGGPGGYVAAIRCGQLGLDTVLVESKALGGTCLNVGCIPSKAIIHAAEVFHQASQIKTLDALGIKATSPELDYAATRSWKDAIVSRLNSGVAGLLRKAKVETIRGWAVMQDGKRCIVESEGGEIEISAECVIIATGSRPQQLSSLPFGDLVIDSTAALALADVPANLAVVGGGYIGMELGMAFGKLGAKVTVVEATDRILRHYDEAVVSPVEKAAKSLGIRLMTDSFAIHADPANRQLTVENDDGKRDQIAADKVLVTVGREAVLDGWGLAEMDLTVKDGFIEIDEQCKTSMTGVFAIGDVTGEPMLAHRAMAQADVAAAVIAGQSKQFDHRSIPAICFTDPQIVSAGLTPGEARAAGYDVISESFPMRANSRAMTMQAEAGFITVCARADNHVVLGIHGVGKDIAELSAGFSIALEMGAQLEDIAGTIHAHPTLSEALHEAALKSLGRGLHL